MTHDLLENPAWHALAGEHAGLGRVVGGGATYDSQVSVFGAVRDAAGLDDLATLMQPGEVVGLALAEPIADVDPARFRQHRVVPCHQMVCEAPSAPPARASEVSLERLEDRHVEEMLALVKLTEPGPFAPRTIEMGNYWGVIEDGRLLAMAGERLKPPGWIELSGVCTHPDGRGRGLAAALCSRVLQGIFERNAQAFLHVVVGGPSETTAVGVYARLGFRHRKRMHVQILERME